VMGVGSFFKGHGGSNWALTGLPERGVFRKIHLQTPGGEKTVWSGMLWAHPVMTVTQSRLGLLVSGSSTQLPRALICAHVCAVCSFSVEEPGCGG